jgi:hypothetical protein
MPDLTMCLGIDCPLADKCYRKTAVPSDIRQSYFMDLPLSKEDDGIICEYFIDNSKFSFEEDRN